LEVHTKKEDNAVFGIYKDHPNCYRSFCVANCMLPPGIEENMDPQRGGPLFTIDEDSEVHRKLSRIKKEEQRGSYMRSMNQFIKNKKTNCLKKGLGPVMRRLCSFCGSASLSSEGYTMIQACEATSTDFSENPHQRLGRLVKQGQRQQPSTGGGTFGMITQGGAQLFRGAVENFHTQGTAAFNQARGYAHEQGRAHFNQARGYAVDQGRDLHNLAQGHVNRVSDQATRARKGAFREVDGFKKRTSGFASSLTDDIAEKRAELTSKLERLQRDATKRQREIKARPSEYRTNALRNLQRKVRADEEKLNEELKHLDELEESGSEGEGDDAEDLDTDLDHLD
jgi:hypothetical protein